MTELDRSLPRLEVSSLPGPETIDRRELSNGMVILARENFASPSVVLSGYLTVGALNEKPEKAGLANLVARSLLRGTEGRTFGQIFEAIESIGAGLSLGAGTHTTAFRGKGLVEDLDLLLDLLADVLRNPSFPEEQIERLRSEHLTALAIRDQSTGARAQMAFDELAYPEHPYRFPSDGTGETVRELSLDDLVGFHRRHYGPRGMVIAVVGGVRTEAALHAVERALGGWERREQSSQRELPPVQAPQTVLREEVPLPGKQQCDIVLGVPGPSRHEDGYLAAALGNSILGRFGLFGRIGEAVRKGAGLAYYAYSSLNGGLGPGPWQVNAGVNPAHVERAIDLIRKEIHTFVQEGVTQDELFENQSHFIGRLPLQLESNEGVASALVHTERYGLGLDYYQRFPDLIAGITAEQVQAMARRYLHADRLAIAVSGPVGESG